MGGSSALVEKNSGGGQEELRRWSRRTPAMVRKNFGGNREELWLQSRRTLVTVGKNFGGGRWQESSGSGSVDAKVGVNKPELLPKEFSSVIDVAGFLSAGQENRLRQEIADLEEETGFKLRVLAQNYPETPGLAIRDFWQVDDRTIVFVADPTFGNILNFNVGATVDLDIPRSFWSRLAGKYGNIFYWKEKGEDASVEAAVKAIATCLREPVGRDNCSEVK
ncbi:Thylakoid lumenal 15.0 kDa protein 2, chloroplastic [Dendrobium catenatum]|uniref:Thylakoid lumenal 15.0 kDa protein 2, chloroplastic n=1 Tax=Dendrobium catenatum TaxID=906689 RepID=A0A2I0VPD9_9ASPA|nr:Thylakoid lumenal 15.0 kDa protein 2, chloroplastic [Dendrobium catenatum]